MDSSGFRSFLGLVKFAFGSESVKYLVLFFNSGKQDIVKLLLKRGADPQSANKDGTTPCDTAGNPEVQLVKL